MSSLFRPRLSLSETITKHTSCAYQHQNPYKDIIDATTMKIALSLVFAPLLAAVALASATQKPVIISYPKDTPTSVLDEAKDAIRKAVCV